MNLAIYSGDDWLNLDQAILNFKKNYLQILDYSESAGEITLTKLQLDVQSQGFFSQKRLLIFQNIFLHQVNRGKISEKVKDLLGYLSQPTTKTFETDILFIENDSNKKKYYEQFFPQAVYKSFKLSPNLFYFLDNCWPNNWTKCSGYYQKSLSDNAPELVFHMLKRRIRELILLLNNDLRGNYQPWQLAKLKSQAKYWTSNKLLEIYKTLYRIEKNVKTGQTPLDFDKSLQILLSLTV
jgi:DNA polymerase III delta subunit